MKNQLESEQNMSAQQNGFVIMPNDDEFRPKILQRPVTILKRPSSHSSSSLGHNSNSFLENNKPKQHMKTLEQREKEYAEARLRILGSAKSPEEVYEK